MRRSKLRRLVDTLDGREEEEEGSGDKSNSGIERSQALEKEVARLESELSSVRLQVT